MPRPRFEKLEPQRRASLLRIAAEEFAEHGYEAASYNRIIERSGLSKGAIYYYFDDKDDLYATVLRDALQRLVVDVGELGSVEDAAGFWREFEAWYIRSLRRFHEEPSAIGLARSLVNALARGVATGALAELRRFAHGWVLEFIAQGQALGAVRDDLPHDLLVPLVMSLEEAIDLWLSDRIGGMSDADIVSTAALLTRLYRRVTAPEPSATKRSPTARTTSKSRRKNGRHRT